MFSSIKRLAFIFLIFSCLFSLTIGIVFANGSDETPEIIETQFSDDLETITSSDVIDLQANGLPVPLTQEPQQDIQEGGYALGAGDKVKVTVFGEKDLSGDFKIGSDGTIAMPLIGIVDVNNLDIRLAEKRIEQKLQNGYLKNPSVTIEVLESRPFYILGEVRRPGSYNYISGMSVLQAIAISGGFTYRANRKEVDILRGNAAPTKPVSATPHSDVKPGDIIFVRERFF